MDGASADDIAGLFFGDLVCQYVDQPGFVRRAWLEEEIEHRLSLPSCRYVLLVGEPGAGKSGALAHLANRNPAWLRYFMRRDSVSPLSGGDAVSALLRMGHQLATRRPDLFDPSRLEVIVTQRLSSVGPHANVVGVRIEDLTVSPFHRTAIRVEQSVEELAGGLVGLEVAHARLEPRLLTEANLQYLALFDPVAVLAESEPDTQVVVLIDAVDEALRFRGAMSVLDWLEQSPELPSNVRVVVSSRPHPRLKTLESVRSDSVEVIEMKTNSSGVLADTRAFAGRLLAEPVLAARLSDHEVAVERVARASEGNFAYLRALERALYAALAAGNDELFGQLLLAEVLPAGLGSLYSVLLRNVRGEIRRLGELDIERPRSDDDESTPAWEGAGQRVVSLLAVASAPLTVEQFIRLGSIRVWKSAAEGIVERLRPLLDGLGIGGSGAAWRFFHSSVGDFLTSEEAPEDLRVEASEWHRRIVRDYRGGSTWSQVDWETTDDYGLVHLANHLIGSGEDGRRQISELVTRGFRTASRRRFLTELTFTRLVETALVHVDAGGSPGETLARALFLDVVRSHLSEAGLSHAPATFGLMARVGRWREAQARIELLPPGEHRFAATQALVACAPELDGRKGADLLVATAVEVPAIDGMLLHGVRRSEAVEAAALALAPYDLERALALVASSTPDPEGLQTILCDRLLLAAVRVATPTQAIVLISRISTGRRSSAAAEIARSVGPADRDRLITLAERYVDTGDPNERISGLAELVASGHVEPYASQLRDAVASSEVNDSAVFTAAETIKHADPHLAEVLLDRVGQSDSDDNWGKIRAVRLWAELGSADKGRALAEKILNDEKKSPLQFQVFAIAELAVALDQIDSNWANQLADEAEGLVNEAILREDQFERSHVDHALGEVSNAFRVWAPDRALRNARLQGDYRIRGVSWESFYGRQSALACLGIDASRTDRKLAQSILQECAIDEEPVSLVGRSDPQLVWGGLFRPAEEGAAGTPPAGQVIHYVTYLTNCLNYWFGAREQIPFTDPADVARRIQMSPSNSGSSASWASVVATAVGRVADSDLNVAIDMAGWLCDPGERLIALAGLSAALTSASDERAADAMAAVGRAAVGLPVYVPGVDLDTIDQKPFLTYLNPSARARWEAALLLPPDEAAVADALATATGSEYLVGTLRAHQVMDFLSQLDSEHADEETVQGALASAENLSDDPIQLDLVRLAAVWTLAPSDAANEMVTLIQGPGYGLRGQLLAGRDLQSALDSTPANLPVLQRVAALAWFHVFETALIDLRSAEPDPLTAALAEILLATQVEQPTVGAGLVRSALDHADAVENVYLRNDALAELLNPAVLTGDVALILTVTRRLLTAGWEVLMEGLRRSVDPLIDLAGPDVFEELDTAFRTAQAVVGVEADHLDGVSAPRIRRPALLTRAAASPSQSAYVGELDHAISGFLEAEDLPEMELKQDAVDIGPDPGDYAFAACDGISSGLRFWLAAETEPVGQLFDIRLVFPDAERAAAYHAERIMANSESYPSVHDAPLVGENCRVFGGSTRIATFNITTTTYNYVFRVGRVVIKLFVAQGVLAQEPLLVEQVEAIASRIVARLQRD